MQRVVAPCAALVLAATAAACTPAAHGLAEPASVFAEPLATDACERLDNPDQRAVCASRRQDVLDLADRAANAAEPAERAQALAELGHEPCFPLQDACTALAPRLHDEPDPAARRLAAAALTCRCGPAAFDLLAAALRDATAPEDRLALIQAADDAVTSGRTGMPTEHDLQSLADALAALVEDDAESDDVRRAAAGTIPLLGVAHATDRLIEHTADRDDEIRLRAEIAAGNAPALIPGLLDRFRSAAPADRAGALHDMASIAGMTGTDQAALLEAALLGGEDRSPDVRDAAARLDPTMFLEGDRETLARVVVAHLLRGTLLRDAPEELALLHPADEAPSRIRRQVLAAAALLAVAVAGPAGDMGPQPADDDADPFAVLHGLLQSPDPEERLVALAAVRRGLEQAATVRRPADANPLVDAIERGQGDRLRIALTLAGRTIEPGRWEPLLPDDAREALARPLDRALLDTFDRISVWHVPEGDATSEQARLLAVYDRKFAHRIADDAAGAADVEALDAATHAADLALAAEDRAETTIPCLARTAAAWDGGFPHALSEFRALGAAAAGTACQDDELILDVQDLDAACGDAHGDAGEAVADRCR